MRLLDQLFLTVFQRYRNLNGVPFILIKMLVIIVDAYFKTIVMGKKIMSMPTLSEL